jgi:methionyl-tRNA synthetase
MKQKSFYITTTLPYVNAPLHMGHALEMIRADAVARYKKLAGFDVFFNTGTDEHGKKNYDKALELGLNPQEFADRAFETFREQLGMFGVGNNPDLHFIRTTEKRHIQAAQEFWRRVQKNGYIYKKNYQAKYCVGCEAEKTNSELDEKGECPLHPGKALELIDEENYFFKLSEFDDKLLQFYKKCPNFVVPDFRLNEMKNLIQAGLKDISISRLKEKMPWGIPVPGDDEHVIYVWFEALVDYISTLGWPKTCANCASSAELAQSASSRPEEPECNFCKYWIHGTPTQYCGKDNTRFQAVIWQAMLMAAGLPNSYQIVVNGFITAEGGARMSKTVGNVVDPRDIVKEYGADALRYFLLREVSSFEDSPFTLERFKEAYNAGLANGLGNLMSRIMTMAVNYNVSYRDYLNADDELTDNFHGFPGKEIGFYESFELNKIMEDIWHDISALDVYIQREKPFEKIKTSEIQAKKDIAYLCSQLYRISSRLEPLLPETSQKIQESIKQNKKPETPLFIRK